MKNAKFNLGVQAKKRRNRRLRKSKSFQFQTEQLEDRRLLAIWSGAVDNSWGTPGNWDVGVPGPGDVAEFNGMGVGVVDLGGVNRDANNIVFSAGGYTLNNGDLTLAASGAATIDNTGTNSIDVGTLILGASPQINVDGDLTVSNINGAGTDLSISGSGTLNFPTENDIGGDISIAGTATVNASHGSALGIAPTPPSVFDFGTGDGGFVASMPTGSANWNYTGSQWDTVYNASSTTDLTSPVLTATDGSVTLDLLHSYNFEGGLWDGGQVEYNINGGGWLLATPAGGYDGNNVVWGGSNPDIVGEPIFGNSSGGQVADQFIIPTLTNDTFQFRFRAGWDSSISGTVPNWTLNTATVHYEPAAPGPLPGTTVEGGATLQVSGGINLVEDLSFDMNAVAPALVSDGANVVTGDVTLVNSGAQPDFDINMTPGSSLMIDGVFDADTGRTISIDGGDLDVSDVVLDGDTDFETLNGGAGTLRNITETAQSNVTFSGDGSGSIFLPTDNTFSGTSLIESGATVRAGSNGALGVDAFSVTQDWDFAGSDNGFVSTFTGDTSWAYAAGSWTVPEPGTGTPSSAFLDSPASAFTAAGNQVRMTLEHSYSFEDGGWSWDGGVVDLDRGGAGTFGERITPLAGYPQTMNVCCGQPIPSGTAAYARNSGGAVTDTFLINTTPGEELRFRMFAGFDNFVAGFPGWDVTRMVIEEVTPIPTTLQGTLELVGGIDLGESLTVDGGTIVNESGNNVLSGPLNPLTDINISLVADTLNRPTLNHGGANALITDGPGVLTVDQVNLTGNAIFQANNDSQMTLSNMSAPGAETVTFQGDGTGEILLPTLNAYSGVTNVDAGAIVELGNPLALGTSAGAVTVYDHTAGDDGGFISSGTGGAADWTFTGSSWQVVRENAESAFLDLPLAPASPTIEVEINHSYQFEGGAWDGGRVETDAAGAGFVGITPDGGYPGTVATWAGQANLGGEAAFVNSSAGTANDTFPAFGVDPGAGSSLRFHASWDATLNGPDPNWTILSTTITEVANGANTVINGTVRLGGGVVLGEDFDVGAGGTIESTGDNTLVGGITTNGDLTVDVLDGSLTLSTSITGPQGVTKVGPGTAIFSDGNTNDYMGATTVSAGILEVRGNGQLGDTTAGTTVQAGGTLSVNSVDGPVNFPPAEIITLNGAGHMGIGALLSIGDNTVGGLNMGSDVSVGVSDGDTLTVSGALSGTNDLTKVGTGTMLLAASSPAYDGNLIVERGMLQVNDLGALGTAVGNTTVQVGGTLGVSNVGTIVGETILLDGLGSTGQGALLNLAGANTIDISGGGIAPLNNQLSFGNVDTANTLTVTGGAIDLGAMGDLIVGGAGDTDINGGVIGSAAPGSGFNTVNKLGTGTLTLAGTSNYTGVTNINDGTLVAADPTALGTTDAGTVVAANATLEVSGVTTAEDISLGERRPQTILDENFDAGALPAGWTSNILEGTEPWAFGAHGPTDIDGSVHAFFDDDAAGPGNNNTVELVSLPVDGSPYDTVEFTFDYAFTALGGSSLSADVWDGAAWVNVFTTAATGGGTVTVDVTPQINPAMQVRFIYDDNDGWQWWAGVDNVQLVGEFAPPVVPPIYSENFDSVGVGPTTVAPAGWTTNLASGTNPWLFGQYIRTDIDGTPHAYFDDDIIGPGAPAAQIELLSPVINLASYTEASIAFDYLFRTFTGTDAVTVDVWDGAAWNNVQTITAGFNSTVSGNLEIDVSASINADFQVRFTYDDGGDWEWYTGIDNFEVFAELAPPPPTPIIADFQDFNSVGGGPTTTPPAGWTTSSPNASEWLFGNYVRTDIDGTPHAYFDDDIIGGGAPAAEIELFSPVIDISSFGSANLEYDWLFAGPFVGSSLFVDVWDGNNWVNVQTVNPTALAVYTGHQNVDVTPFANTNFQTRFTFSDQGGNWEYWTGIDNYMVSGLNVARLHNTTSTSTLTGNVEFWEPAQLTADAPITIDAAATTFIGQGASVLIDGNSDVTFDSNVVGSFTGPMTINNTATVTLNGNNTFDSAIRLNSGSLVATTDTALGSAPTPTTIDIASGATMTLMGGLNISNEHITADGVGAGDGAIVSAGGNNTLDATGSITANPAGTGLLIGSTSVGEVFDILADINLNSSQLDIGGAGTVRLNGDVTGTPGNVLVMSPATLGGAGSITGDLTVQTGASYSPGNSPGTFTIGGNLTLSAGSVLNVEVEDGVGFDEIVVGGDVDVTGATLNIYTNTVDPSNQYIIIDNQGGNAVTGEFAGRPEGAGTVSDDDGFLFDGGVSYVAGDGNDIRLDGNEAPVLTAPVPDTITVTMERNTGGDQTGQGTGDVLTAANVTDSDPLDLLDTIVTAFLITPPTYDPAFAANFNADGTFVYTPQLDLHGTAIDSFVYGVTDGEETATATVTINIDIPADPPEIVSLTPANGAKNVGLNDTMTADFDEHVYLGTGNIDLMPLCGVQTPIETIDVTNHGGQLSGEGTNSITIDFNTTLQFGVEYWVRIAPGAITDTPGTPATPTDFAGVNFSTDWGFSTSSQLGGIDGIYINEVLHNPEDGDHGNEYVELRGPLNYSACPNTYVLAVNGDADGNLGEVEHVFDIGGTAFGSNGFMVLAQDAAPYNEVATDAIYEVAADGAGWNDAAVPFRHDGPEDLKNTSTSFIVVRSDLANAPVPGDDIDANDDGTYDGAKSATWIYSDSIGFTDGSAGDMAYGDIAFYNTVAPLGTVPTQVEVPYTVDYLARAGDTTESDAADWVAALVDGQNPSYSVDAAASTPATYAGEPLDHIGSSNFAVPLTIVESGGSTDVTEGLTVDTFQIGPNTSPTSNVAITLDGNGQTEVSLNGSTYSSSVTANFTSSALQTIHVRAVDDAISEGNHQGSILISTTSSDSRFEGLSTSLDVNITDNDPAVPDLEFANVIIHQVSANSLDLSVTVVNNGTAAADLNGLTASQNDNIGIEAYTGPDDIHDNQGDQFAFNRTLGQSPLPILAPGETFTTTFSFSNMNLDLDFRPNITLKVDGDDLLDEGSGESNNIVSVPLVAQPVFFFETPNDVFAGTPGSTIEVTVSAQAITQDVLAYQLNFDNSSAGLEFSNWQNNNLQFPFTLDGTIDSGSGDYFVGASTFASPLVAPVVLGTFDLTLPTAPGDYTLSVNQLNGVDMTVLSDANNDPIPVFFYGDQNVVVSNDTTPPEASFLNPLDGISTNVDLGYVDIQLADPGVNPTGIALASVDPTNIVIAGGAVDVDQVLNLGGGSFRYIYDVDGDTLPDTSLNGDGTAIDVQVLNDPTDHPNYNPGNPDAISIVHDGAGNLITGVTGTFIYDGTLPSVTQVNINPNIADPADRPLGPQPSSWVIQRSDINEIEIIFSEVVNLTVDNITLTNLGVDPDVDADTVIALDASQFTLNGNVVTLDFVRDDLGDGVYQVEVNGATDALGNVMAPFSLTGNTAEPRLYEFEGDWNGDGRVTIFDFNVLAYWFGIAAAPEYVDLNEDGGISIFDFPFFRDKFTFGLELDNPPSAAADAIALALNGFDLGYDVLGNDSPGLSVIAVNGSVAGEAADNPFADIWINPDNTVGYEAADIDYGYTGVDQFTYTVQDVNGITSVGTVTVSVGVPRSAVQESETDRDETRDQLFADLDLDLVDDGRLDVDLSWLRSED